VEIRKRAILSARQFSCELLVGHEPDGTVSTSRNGLAERATSAWLLFLDADDELAPGYLGAMERAAEQAGDGPVLLTPAVSYVRKGKPAPPQFNDRGIPLSQDNWLVVGTLIQTDLFHAVGGFPDYPHGFEDWALWAKAEKAGARIVKVPEAVYVCHVNPRSKHKIGWRDRKWQVQTHNRVAEELAAWTP
jgi:GT2 family glycosyltransferase